MLSHLGHPRVQDFEDRKSQFCEGRTGNERKVLAKDCPLDKALHGNQHPFPSASRFNAHKGSVPHLSTQKYKEKVPFFPSLFLLTFFLWQNRWLRWEVGSW